MSLSGSILYRVVHYTLKGSIGYIVANLKGVVIKEFVIEAPKLLPFLVLP